jgi:hypothetical protein
LDESGLININQPLNVPLQPSSKDLCDDLNWAMLMRDWPEIFWSRGTLIFGQQDDVSSVDPVEVYVTAVEA